MDRTRAGPARRGARRAVALAGGLALATGLALGGCAKPGSQPSGGGGAVHPPFGFPSSGKPRPTGPETTISGVMRAGVEANCMVLTTSDGTDYQLLGGDRSIYRVGARLTVTGHVTTGVMTTCMQGTLFTVTKVVSAS